MATLIEAGLPISKSLRQRHSVSLSKITSEMADSIERGEGGLAEQMGKYPGTFSRLECQLINVGERTGHIDRICKNLAESFKLQSKMKSKIIAGLMYPGLLFHFAAVIGPSLSFILGGSSLAETILSVLLFLSLPYAVLTIYLILKHSKKILGLELPDFIYVAILNIPLAGLLIRKLDYVRFFRCYGATIGAGMPVALSIKISAETCSNPWIRNSFLKCSRKVEGENCTFHEAFEKYVFPSDRDSIALSLMETGEISGTPDKSAKNIADIYQSEAEQALTLIADMVPKIIYFALAAYIGFKVIRSWQIIFSKTTEIGE